jgi:hypothetical protein
MPFLNSKASMNIQKRWECAKKGGVEKNLAIYSFSSPMGVRQELP